MGRTYAGILGPLAFLTIILRGLVSGATLFGTMQSAIFALVAFSFVGLIAGAIGNNIVHESIRTTMADEIAQLNNEESNIDLFPS